jgi:hypothetical protein
MSGEYGLLCDPSGRREVVATNPDRTSTHLVEEALAALRSDLERRSPAAIADDAAAILERAFDEHTALMTKVGREVKRLKQR